MGDPFEELGQTASRPTHRKIVRENKQPMVPSPVEKAVQERAAQLRNYLKLKRGIRRGLVEGIYGADIVQLLRLIRKTPDADVLVHWVRNSKWLMEAPLSVRYSILGYIDQGLARWNVRHGIAPYNDNLPGDGQPDSPFLQVRKILTGV